MRVIRKISRILGSPISPIICEMLPIYPLCNICLSTNRSAGASSEIQVSRPLVIAPKREAPRRHPRARSNRCSWDQHLRHFWSGGRHKAATAQPSRRRRGKRSLPESTTSMRGKHHKCPGGEKPSKALVGGEGKGSPHTLEPPSRAISSMSIFSQRGRASLQNLST